MGIAAILFFTLFPHVADAQISPGVQQSAAQTATLTGSILQSDGTPIAGADVQLFGPAKLSTTSDAHGTFNFTGVPYGMYRIVAVSAGFGVSSRDDVVIKGDLTVMIRYEAQSGSGGLKTIAHVSTRSSGAEINVTPANIASINPSDYAFQGNTSWRQLLDRIPGVTVGGTGGGASTNAVIPDSPFQPILLSINAALPYETSTTLDGMPLNNTTFGGGAPGYGVDLSFLPLPAFDTADVVRGPGANAPSIVDSIGGSFVLHAPGQVTKSLFQFSASNDPYGGIVSNTKAAVRFGRLSATIVYGINNSPGPLGNQTVTDAIFFTPATVNGQLFWGCGTSSCSNQLANTPTYQNCYCEYQNALLIGGVPISTAWVQHNGALGLAYDITPSVTAQLFYAGSSSRMEQAGEAYPVDFMPASGYAGNIVPGMHTLIYSSGPAAIAESSSLLEEKITAYVGHSVIRLAALQNNSFTQQSIPDFLPDGQYTLYGVGYLGNASPGTSMTFNGTTANLTFTPTMFSSISWVNNRDILGDYEVQMGSSSGLGISYTTTYYNEPNLFHETYSTFLNLVSSRPSAVSETTTELRIHGSTELSERLSIDASWYFARGEYHVQNPSDSTGQTYVDSVFPYSAPRVGVVWRANPNVAVRAAAGGGYALPPLFQLLGTNAIYLCGPFYQEFKTNLHLKPEQSFGFDMGTDIRLHQNTVLSFDLYHTDLYGQFFQSTNLTGTIAGLPLYTTQYDNLSHSRYEGINLDIRHDVARGLYWHGALGLTRAYVVNVPSGFYDSPSTGPNSVNTYIVPGINFDGQFQSAIPYATGTAQIGYRWDPEKYIDISPTYYGHNNAYFEPAFIEFDAHAGYPVTKNISLLATFRNITGIYGRNYQYFSPTLGAPTVAGQPFALFGLPYGPRTVIVTANIHS